ncbi:MAG: NADPH-dependent reductase [Phycisphaerales bacterium]|nr:NADPH-dependent reductase [Phycisphaerales bacterium]
MTHRPLLVVSGTNRPGSVTLKVARAVLGHYAKLGVPAELYDLTDLPPDLFLPTAYAAKPAAFVAVQQRVVAAAGLHVVTPEYNGSFPGVLKYFIDMLKFPESFVHKPVAFVGVAGGVWGALRPVEQLQMVFAYRNAHLYPDRVFAPGVAAKLAADGSVTDPDLDARLAKQAEGFARFAHVLGGHAAGT